MLLLTTTGHFPPRRKVSSSLKRNKIILKRKIAKLQPKIKQQIILYLNMAIQRRSFLTRLGLGIGALVTASFDTASKTINAGNDINMLATQLAAVSNFPA